MNHPLSKALAVLCLAMSLAASAQIWAQSGTLPKSPSADNFQSRLADVNTLAEVSPKEFVVGVRSDASPFSYKTVARVQEDILSGYGGYMVEVCRRVLSQMISSGPFSGFKIKPYDITAGNRFELLETGKVDMLCGPDSITLNRLKKNSASHPMFLSGLTYVSVANDAIPRTAHCDGVIGLVRRTTAESTGLGIIARNRELGRFHAPLEAYLAIMSNPEGYEVPNRDKEIAQSVLTDAVLDFLPKDGANDGQIKESMARKSAQPIEPGSNNGVSETVLHPADWIVPETVTTGECRNGYTNGPVVFFDNHVSGLNALCSGEILFYMGDFDIIRERLNRMSNCETVMRRETITDEAYGAYFRKYKGEGSDENRPSRKSSYLDSLLYAEFNNVLLQKMQVAESILDYEFIREFGDEKKTEDLQQFFDSFKFASHY